MIANSQTVQIHTAHGWKNYIVLLFREKEPNLLPTQAVNQLSHSSSWNWKANSVRIIVSCVATGDYLKHDQWRKFLVI